MFLSPDGYGAEISSVSAATERTSHFECQPGYAGVNDGPETLRLSRQVVIPQVLLTELNHWKQRRGQSSGGFNLASVVVGWAPINVGGRLHNQYTFLEFKIVRRSPRQCQTSVVPQISF